MKSTTKVTLLSLLVFPGVGHLILKKYPIAAAFIISVSYLLFGLISKMMETSQKIADRIIQGDIPIDLTAITEALTQQMSADGSSPTFTWYLLITLWLFAAFDAYRLAKRVI